MTKTVKRGTAEICQAMRKRYPSTAYALFFEVGNGTGMNCNRHADAIAMSLWPSRGLGILGFEFKCSRSDWVKERDDPAKAESIQKYCDHFYLVVANSDIVQPGELPESWGLLVLTGQGTLRGEKAAPALTPCNLDRSFVAALMRRAAEPMAAVDAQVIRAAEERGRSSEAARNNAAFERLTKELADLNREVAAFENTTGLTLRTRWHGSTAQEIATAISCAKDSGEFIRSQLENAKRVLIDAASKCEHAINGIRGIEGGHETQA